jgi:hypothetical protein
LIRETLENTHAMLYNYQDYVNRISKRAQDLMLPEIERKEEALKKNKAPNLSTSARANRRKPDIEAIDLEPNNRKGSYKYQSDMK